MPIPFLTLIYTNVPVRIVKFNCAIFRYIDTAQKPNTGISELPIAYTRPFLKPKGIREGPALPLIRTRVDHLALGLPSSPPVLISKCVLALSAAHRRKVHLVQAGGND